MEVILFLLVIILIFLPIALALWLFILSRRVKQLAEELRGAKFELFELRRQASAGGLAGEAAAGDAPRASSASPSPPGEPARKRTEPLPADALPADALPGEPPPEGSAAPPERVDEELGAASRRERVEDAPPLDAAPTSRSEAESPPGVPPLAGAAAAAAGGAGSGDGSAAAPPAATPEPARGGRSFEERLFGRLPVWIGAVALALSGFFLVAYSLEKGLLTPTTRVVLATLFGVALLAVGSFMHRRQALVGAGLSAAGIADLFGAFYAASSLYALVSAPLAFGLMALTTATAILLALRQGPIIAVVGLVGGVLAPALTGAEAERPFGLFSYLFVLQVGLLLVARSRRWWWLALLGSFAAFGWSMLWLALRFDVEDGASVALFAAASAFVAALASWRRADAEEASDTAEGFEAFLGRLVGARGVTSIALALAALATGWAILATDFGGFEFAVLLLVAAGGLVLARADARYLPAAGLALGVVLALLAAQSGTLAPGGEGAAALAGRALAAFALFVVGGRLAMLGAPRSLPFALVAALGGALVPIVAYLGLEEFYDPPGLWGALALAAALLLVALAWPIGRARARRLAASASDETDAAPATEFDAPLAAFALAVCLLAAAALPMELTRAVLTVALALEVAAVAWVAGRLRLGPLRWFGLALGAIVGLRLLGDPLMLAGEVGARPLFNLLLFAYGVSALALWWAAARHRAQRDARGAAFLELLAALVALALGLLEVRHAFAGPSLEVERMALGEWGLHGLVLALGAWALLAFGRRLKRVHLVVAGWASCAIAALVLVVVAGLVENPIFAPASPDASTPLWALVVTYGLGALAFAPLVREASRHEIEASLRNILGAVGVALVFLLVSSLVRYAFHGSQLALGGTSNREWIAYSVAWLLLGLALLTVGIARRAMTPLWASLVVMLVTIVKVFVFDVRELDLLYRSLSFLGLGVSLMLLAYLYRRFVFGRASAEAPR